MASKAMSIFLIFSLLLSLSQQIDYAAESLKVHAFYKGKLSCTCRKMWIFDWCLVLSR